ncbi:MAG: hypothetical protein RMY34_07565 [Aulosira sp. DedQUE10]|nr:hypothetical protein [Aulosira sp. DedQUE10]
MTDIVVSLDLGTGRVRAIAVDLQEQRIFTQFPTTPSSLCFGRYILSSVGVDFQLTSRTDIKSSFGSSPR